MSVLLLCVPHGAAGPDVFRAWDELGVPGVRVRAVALPDRDPAVDASSWLDQLADEVAPQLSDGPAALFGHGPAALVCLDLAARLHGRGGPLRLIASGSPGPRDAPDPVAVPVTAVRGSADDTVSREDAAGWARATTGAFELLELPGGHDYHLDQGRAVLAAVTRADVARELAELWQDLLGIGAVGVGDDFFALGGDSNSGLLMISHARRHGIAITLRDLFRLRTAEAIARQCVRA